MEAQHVHHAQEDDLHPRITRRHVHNAKEEPLSLKDHFLKKIVLFVMKDITEVLRTTHARNVKLTRTFIARRTLHILLLILDIGESISTLFWSVLQHQLANPQDLSNLRVVLNNTLVSTVEHAILSTTVLDWNAKLVHRSGSGFLQY
jgi:hypothetical protein